MLNKIFLIIFNYLFSLFDLPNKIKIGKFLKKKLLDNDLTVIDIGAHKGETVEFFLQNFKILKIYAFEPNIELIKKLLNTKKLNIKKVDFLNYGVGNEEKDIFLNITIDTASSTFNEINTSSKYYLRKKKILSIFSKNKSLVAKTQKIKIIKLSSFIKEKHLEKIDVLKIDTEGFEFNVLKGLEKKNFKKIRFIYFEHHFDTMIKKNYKFFDINCLLKENNFKQCFKTKMSFRKSFEYIYENKE